MIGDTFLSHFLGFRLISVLLVVIGTYLVIRWRSPHVALSLMTLLAVTSWLFTWLPLERPYGLQVGSPALFDAALAASAATSGSPGESWLRDERSPRPGWGLLWKALSLESAAEVRDWVSLPLHALLPWLVYFAWGPRNREERWEAVACAFTAVFATSLTVDAFRPFGVFESAFFVAPHRILALCLALVALALVWRGRRMWILLAGALAGAVGWIDVGVFVCLGAALLGSDVLAVLRRPARDLPSGWPTAVLGSVIALPPLLTRFRGEALLRGLTPDEAESYSIAFRDVFSVTTDLQWIFFLAVAATPFLWRRGRRADLGALALALSAYLFWAISAWSFGERLLWEPETSFQLVRFAVALLAGSGSYRVLAWVRDWASEQGVGEAALARWQAVLKRLPREPFVFALVLVVLLPSSSVLTWHPLRMDPLYFPSWRYPLEADDVELGAWLREHGRDDDVVVSGPATSEWIAALSGRRVLSGVRVVPRETRRERRRALRTLFLAGDPVATRRAIESLGATLLVLDRELREEFRQADFGFLESSGFLRRAHQVGDRYTVYRLR